jgi:hypothetical protein
MGSTTSLPSSGYQDSILGGKVARSMSVSGHSWEEICHCESFVYQCHAHLVLNEWSCTSTPPYVCIVWCLDNLTLTNYHPSEKKWTDCSCMYKLGNCKTQTTQKYFFLMKQTEWSQPYHCLFDGKYSSNITGIQKIHHYIFLLMNALKHSVNHSLGTTAVVWLFFSCSKSVVLNFFLFLLSGSHLGTVDILLCGLYDFEQETVLGWECRVQSVKFLIMYFTFSAHHHCVQTGFRSHPASYPIGAGRISRVVKQPDREADHIHLM